MSITKCRQAAPASVIAALALSLVLPFGGCVVDWTDPTADDDDSAVEDEPVEVEPPCGYFVERYWRDVDGDSCLSYWERDEPKVDLWLAVYYCGAQGFVTVGPDGVIVDGLPPYPYLSESSDQCLPEEDEEPSDDDDSAVDEEPSDDDDVVSDDDDSTPDEDPASDDDDAVSDDDDSVVDAPLVQVTRAGFTGAWDIRVFNWDQLIGFWWGTSPEYCSYGIGDSLGCYIEIASGDRFSVNGVISAGGWLVTAAPADFISRISVNGVTYPVTESRSSSPAVGPWTDVSPGTCRYGAVGHNDLWCRGASSL